MIQQAQQRLGEALRRAGYVADRDLLASLHLSTLLQKPLLLEGEAGVGKTDVARVLATINQSRLIRLQCYEGLDAQHALYEWDYARQLLAIQLNGNIDQQELSRTIYSESYLLKRPLLEAITASEPVVLLIDEIDRADEEFEALLLEVLSDFQVSIPEIGTLVASQRPTVILTSNGVRELSDALRRRCLYHYIEYPDMAREIDIVEARIKGIRHSLAQEVVAFVQQLRLELLRKTPGVAETLDWAQALLYFRIDSLADAEAQIDATLNCLIKTRDDLALLRQDNKLAQLLLTACSGSSYARG